ncbi:MAG TPA: AtzH-like domain-containing protein [Burkholderiales bacterium]|nr:AtzH-like domain-containing protein [Burkholderiales bacterium]
MKKWTAQHRFSGLLGAALCAVAITATSHAQSEYLLNDPQVVGEIEALVADYNRALLTNDVASLNRFFLDSPTSVRFGNAENLYGIEQIRAYRASVTAPPSLVRESVIVTTYGRDFATVAMRNVPGGGRIGRTMQTWVRFPGGWRIVAAHVSTMTAP